jgi:hypothetical protein
MIYFFYLEFVTIGAILGGRGRLKVFVNGNLTGETVTYKLK